MNEGDPRSWSKVWEALDREIGKPGNVKPFSYESFAPRAGYGRTSSPTAKSL